MALNGALGRILASTPEPLTPAPGLANRNWGHWRRAGSYYCACAGQTQKQQRGRRHSDASSLWNLGHYPCRV